VVFPHCVIEEAQNVAIISADNQWSIRDRVDAGESSVESFRTGKERVIRAFERDYLQKMLDRHEGNITHAAQAAAHSGNASQARRRRTEQALQSVNSLRGRRNDGTEKVAVNHLQL